MWTRRELKERAKGLFKANYWKAVLAALALTLIASGGSSAGSTSGVSSAINSMQSMSTSRYSYNIMQEADDLDLDDILEDGFIENISGGSEELQEALSGSDVPMGVMLATAGMVFIMVLIAAAIGIALDILIMNPLEVGIRRFFTVNLYEKARAREMAYGFDHSYKNVIKVMFFRDLYTVLWTLLFIIPGIVKSYEYRMIPYLLAEYPDMTKEDAFAISKHMMTGNKWKTFVLDLSFILWFLGSLCTLGLLGVFYGNPYYAQTGAVLYDVLKAEKRPFSPQGPQGTDPYWQGPQGADPYQQNANPYQQNMNPYQQTMNPYQQSANPYQQNMNSYQQNMNPYQQNANPYQQNMNPYQQNMNPYQQPAQNMYPYQQGAQNMDPYQAPVQNTDPYHKPVQDTEPVQPPMDTPVRPAYNETVETGADVPAPQDGMTAETADAPDTDPGAQE